MPEFILDKGDAAAALAVGDLPPFVRGYVEAMFFTNTGTGDDGDLESATFAELAPEAVAQCVADCAAFQAKAADLLALAYARDDYGEEQAGRDYWFTRNGHGVGFWSREQLDDSRDLWRECGSPRVDEPGWPEYQARKTPTVGERLSDLARYSEVSPYRGDDGLIYLM